MVPAACGWASLPINRAEGGMSIKVLIADDAILFREGVKSFFGTDSGILIVGEADDALDVAAQTVAAGADVVLLDEDLPG